MYVLIDLIQKLNYAAVRKGLTVACIMVIVIFPFTSNPAAVDWEDLNLTEAQENATAVATFVKQQKNVPQRFIYTDPFLSEALNIDPFNSEIHQILAQNNGIISPKLKNGDLIIWDSWHSVIDYGVTPEFLASLKVFKEFKNGNSIYRLYFYESKRTQIKSNQ